MISPNIIIVQWNPCKDSARKLYSPHLRGSHIFGQSRAHMKQSWQTPPDSSCQLTAVTCPWEKADLSSNYPNQLHAKDKWKRSYIWCDSMYFYFHCCKHVLFEHDRPLAVGFFSYTWELYLHVLTVNWTHVSCQVNCVDGCKYASNQTPQNKY